MFGRLKSYFSVQPNFWRREKRRCTWDGTAIKSTAFHTRGRKRLNDRTSERTNAPRTCPTAFWQKMVQWRLQKQWLNSWQKWVPTEFIRSLSFLNWEKSSFARKCKRSKVDRLNCTLMTLTMALGAKFDEIVSSILFRAQCIAHVTGLEGHFPREKACYPSHEKVRLQPRLKAIFPPICNW